MNLVFEFDSMTKAPFLCNRSAKSRSRTWSASVKFSLVYLVKEASLVG